MRYGRRPVLKDNRGADFEAAVETVAWTDSIKAARVAEAYAAAKSADDVFEDALVKAYRGRGPGPTVARYDLEVRKTWPAEVWRAYQLK